MNPVFYCLLFSDSLLLATSIFQGQLLNTFTPTPLPVRNVEIRVKLIHGQAIPGDEDTDDFTLPPVYTDNNGQFAIGTTEPWDTYIVTAYLNPQPENGVVPFVVVDTAQDVQHVTVDELSDPMSFEHGDNNVININYSATGADANLFHIYDALLTTHGFYKNAAAQYGLKAISDTWKFVYPSTEPNGGLYFPDGTPAKMVDLSGPGTSDPATWDTAAHEYSHRIQLVNSFNTGSHGDHGLENERWNRTGNANTFAEAQALAWNEGVAEFLGTVSQFEPNGNPGVSGLNGTAGVGDTKSSGGPGLTYDLERPENNRNRSCGVSIDWWN